MRRYSSLRSRRRSFARRARLRQENFPARLNHAIMHPRVRVRCPRFLACVLLAVTSPESIIADDDGDGDAALVNVEIIDDDYAVLYGNYDDDDDDDDGRHRRRERCRRRRQLRSDTPPPRAASA